MLKLYGILWALLAAVALVLFVTGNFTMLTLVGFGFVIFGMIFMGMISVLPSSVGHHAAPQPIKVKAEPVIAAKEKSSIFDSKHLATR